MKTRDVETSRMFMHVFLIVLIVIPTAVCLAQFGGGEGTEADPWLIGRPEHLNEIRNYLGEEHNDKHFIQTANINLDVPPWNEGQGWTPIGVYADAFTGTYNGNDHFVDGLFINRPVYVHPPQDQGLFGYVSGAKIINLGVINVDVTGHQNVGTIAARIDNNSLVKNCYSTGEVRATRNLVGGLIGFINNDSLIDKCFSSCTVRGNNQVGGLVAQQQRESIVRSSYSSGDVYGEQYVGGLTAQLAGNALITDSYAIGNVRGDNEVGGLVGRMWHGNIRNSYSRGNVSGENNIAGLVGQSRGNSNISNSYSTGLVIGDNTGGLIANNFDNNPVVNCYWDIETSNQEESAGGGYGRTTNQMSYPYGDETYANWDFEEVWLNDVRGRINDGYPFLRFQDITRWMSPPQVTADTVFIENIKHIRLSWEQVEDARSYKIYTSNDPYAEDWGEPIEIVGADVTVYVETIHESGKKFFYVTASIEEAP